jgi:DNA-binding NarL/FixJ family response regulator
MVTIQQSILRRAVTAYLRSLPGALVVRSLSSLAETLPALDRECPGILVLDADAWEAGCCAPPMDLPAILRRVCPGLSLIALADSAEQVEKCLASGADAALQKGCLDERLGQAIASCLREAEYKVPGN